MDALWCYWYACEYLWFSTSPWISGVLHITHRVLGILPYAVKDVLPCTCQHLLCLFLQGGFAQGGCDDVLPAQSGHELWFGDSERQRLSPALETLGPPLPAERGVCPFALWCIPVLLSLFGSVKDGSLWESLLCVWSSQVLLWGILNAFHSPINADHQCGPKHQVHWRDTSPGLFPKPGAAPLKYQCSNGTAAPKETLST